MTVVTIEGDRQSGKTEMAIDLMVRRAEQGASVAYVARKVTCSEVHRRVEERGGFLRSSRAHGDCGVFYSSGGRILFLSSQANAGRGLVLHTVVMDDGTADNDNLVASCEAAMVAAKAPTLVKIVARS